MGFPVSSMSLLLLVGSGIPRGAVVKRCEERYCERLGLDSTVIRPLRLLCWIVHSRSDYRHLELETVAPPEQSPSAAASSFLCRRTNSAERSGGAGGG
jgi:hypothetical protein